MSEMCSPIKPRNGMTDQIRKKISITIPTDKIQNQGKMIWTSSVKTSITYSGHIFEHILRGIHHYTNKGIHNKALLCLIEGYRFIEFNILVKDGEKNIYDNVGSVITTIINSIGHAALMNIGIANLSLFIEIIHVVLDNKKERDIEKLYQLVYMMCDSPKSKIASHIHFIMSDPKILEAAISNDIPFNNNIIDDIDEYEFTDSQFVIDLDILLDNYSSACKKDENDTTSYKEKINKIKIYFKMFEYSLQNNHMNAFFWVHKIIDYLIIQTKYEGSKKVKNDFFLMKKGLSVFAQSEEFPYESTSSKTTKKSDILIWRILFLFLENNYVYNTLVDYYYYSTNMYIKMYILYTAILISIYGPEYQPLDYTEYPIDKSHLKKMLHGSYLLDINEPYVIDCFTSEGIRNGKSYDHFRENDNQCSNEEKAYHIDSLSDFYENTSYDDFYKS